MNQGGNGRKSASRVPVLIDRAPTAVRGGKASVVLASLAIVGAIGCATGWAVNPTQFYYSYLIALFFAVTVVLGMLFFVMLHHVTDAGWSTVIRRPAEQVLVAFGALAVLSVPVIIGMWTGRLYPWTTPRTDAERVLVAGKWPLTNRWFFVLSVLVCFGVWLMLTRIMRGNSLAQDHDADPAHSLRMRRFSAVGFFLFAATLTAAAVEWVMTLDYAWFSTIYGVYAFAGGVVGALASLTLIVLALARRPDGALAGLVSSDHLHDLGKLIWAFVIFWAYIAFSQWFLIWYGNIPEETIWFLHRWTGTAAPFDVNWWMVSVLLAAGRFVVPFVVMMAAAAKRNPRVLWVMCPVLLLSHWLDMYWLAMPVLHPEGIPLAWLWLDASAVLLIGGVSGWVVLNAMSRHSIYPLHDPRLGEALSAGHEHEFAAAGTAGSMGN